MKDSSGSLLDLYKTLVDLDALKEEASDFIDTLPVTRKTFLDPKQDDRFTLIKKDEGGYGEIIIKFLPFIDRNNPLKPLITIPIIKHDIYFKPGGLDARISENCPKSIGLECALCDNVKFQSEFKSITRHILNGIVIENNSYLEDVGKIKLIELTPTSLANIANDDNFMNLFDLNNNLCLKIIIEKDTSSGYYTYNNSYIFVNEDLDISLFDNLEPYYSDLKEEIYNNSNYLTYERMIVKYINKYIDDNAELINETMPSTNRQIQKYKSQFESSSDNSASSESLDELLKEAEEEEKKSKKRGRPKVKKEKKVIDDIDINSLIDDEVFNESK